MFTAAEISVISLIKTSVTTREFTEKTQKLHRSGVVSEDRKAGLSGRWGVAYGSAGVSALAGLQAGTKNPAEAGL
jgi:hypothetical protein